MNNQQTEQQKAGAALFAALKNIKDNWPATLELIALQAMSLKAKYDEALTQGFTEAQALELCTKRWEL
jgi:hypothetical protein